jgi:hypothetical protein
LAGLVRRALDERYDAVSKADRLRLLDAAFGAWTHRDESGVEFVSWPRSVFTRIELSIGVRHTELRATDALVGALYWLAVETVIGTSVHDGIHRVSRGRKARHGGGLDHRKSPQTVRNPRSKANSNRSPRLP